MSVEQTERLIDLPQEPENKPKKKKTVFIILFVLLGALLLAFAVAFGLRFYKNQQYTKNLDIGLNYLKEDDYENAILAFNEAIAIDDKNPTAYEYKAEAAVADEDYELASETYEILYELTQDEYYIGAAETNDARAEIAQVSVKSTSSGTSRTGSRPNTLVFEDHEYELVNRDMTWTEAKAYAESVGGHLVTITSQEEQDFIESLLDKSTTVFQGYWIGANRTSDIGWITNEAFDYTNFASGEPNNSGDYFQIYTSSGGWDDTTNDGSGNAGIKQHGFIIEYEDSNASSSDLIRKVSSTYRVFNEPMTWEEAVAYCESLGGHLVTINSAEEQYFIETLLKNGVKNSYWLGAERTSKTGTGFSKWITGEPIIYENYDPPEPNNNTGKEDALMIYRLKNPVVGSSLAFHWNDLQKDGECKGEAFFGIDNIGFICEWDEV